MERPAASDRQQTRATRAETGWPGKVPPESTSERVYREARSFDSFCYDPAWSPAREWVHMIASPEYLPAGRVKVAIESGRVKTNSAPWGPLRASKCRFMTATIYEDAEIMPSLCQSRRVSCRGHSSHSLAVQNIPGVMRSTPSTTGPIPFRTRSAADSARAAYRTCAAA